MTKIWKSTLIAAPALFALAACDAPPAEDPAMEGANDGAEMAIPPVEEPVETAPMGDVAPIDGNLTGGEAPVEESTDPAAPDAATEGADAADTAAPAAGEDSAETTTTE